MTGLTVTLLGPAAHAPLAEALALANLPTADLAEPGRTFFRFDDEALAGYGGLEGDGPDRLLRSFVVATGRRGTGLGRAMLAALERRARALGVVRLHLLTDSAAPFFLANGYAVADRSAAPASIAGSAQFRTLCPASAAYLVKSLERLS